MSSLLSSSSRAMLAEQVEDKVENSVWHFETAMGNPLMLSLLAGMSTCLGATVAFCSGQKKLGHAHMAFSLSLAGSVMITVSVAAILPECFQLEVGDDDNATQAAAIYIGPWKSQFWARCLAFGIGCVLYILLSRCAFPEPEEILGFEQPTSNVEVIPIATAPRQITPDDSRRVCDIDKQYLNMMEESSARAPLLSQQSTKTMQRKLFSKSLKQSGSRSSLQVSSSCDFGDDDGDTPTSKSGKTSEASRAWRVTMLLFISLAVHNFPEGLAVAASSLHSNKLGWTTTVAIALHNIPEGVAIAIPCLAARPDSPWLAFVLASVSGLAEPLGAAVAVFLLKGDDDSGWLNNSDNMKNVLAFVAGVMIMVASIELFPEARRYMTESKIPGVTGTLAGIIIMLSSDAYLDS